METRFQLIGDKKGDFMIGKNWTNGAVECHLGEPPRLRKDYFLLFRVTDGR